MGKSKKLWREVRIEPALFYSEQFQKLSASELRTLMRCLQKRSWAKTRKGKPVYSNDPFIFPYYEAKKVIGVGTTQFYKNINKLIELGFLDLDHQGGWYQKNESEKDYSRYKLSDRWRQYGTEHFKKVVKDKKLNPEFHIRNNIEKRKLKATSQKRKSHLHRSEVGSAQTHKYRLHKSEVDHNQDDCAEGLENTGHEEVIADAKR